MSLLIFDFDGTIADSFQYVYDFLCQEAGGRAPTGNDVESYRRMSMKSMALKLGIPLWRLPYVYFKGRRVMRGHIMHVQPFAGMPQILQQLHADGHTLAIISSNSSRNIKKFLKHNDLGHYFLTVRGGAGIFGKAGLIKQVQRRSKAKNCWYIGDETGDMLSAKAADVLSLAVTWGFASRQALERLEPTAIVDSAEQILATIDSHGR